MARAKPISTRQRILYCFVAAIFIAVLGMATLGYMRSKNDRSVPVKSLASPQQADAPLGFPLPSTGAAPPFDPRFIQLSAFERASVPLATHMASAMGTESGALTYNAQPYWSNNPQRGGHHTGDDLNGIGGMNTDLGDPVYAIANGLVVYRGEPSPGWGKTLVLAHKNHEGTILLSMYAHLDKSFSPFNDLVSLGEVIGTVGTANLNYPAHLHLEMRDSTGIHIGHGYTSDPGESICPGETIRTYRTARTDSLSPNPLAIIRQEQIERRKEGFFGKE
ncbi:MAG: M23 family metallopeptidase [Akkermansiaceae bacterium]|nr:M23 family metallopeptidase [Akkermansiaceae bacterium]